MRRAYEMSAPTTIHSASRGEVVATRRWEQSRRENQELKEASSVAFEMKATMARDMARYQVDLDAARARRRQRWPEPAGPTLWPRGRHAMEMLYAE
jgi:hypothetical protein